MRTKEQGFTLIEVLIAIAIIGILAAIAVPSYNGYVQRGNRVIAKSLITQVVARQESFMSDRKSYATTLSALGYPADTIYVGKSGAPSASATGALYSITLAAYNAANIGSCNLSGSATAMQFAIVATPLNQQTKDTACLKLCQGSLGEKGASGSDSDADCWSR